MRCPAIRQTGLPNARQEGKAGLPAQGTRARGRRSTEISRHGRRVADRKEIGGWSEPQCSHHSKVRGWGLTRVQIESRRQLPKWGRKQRDTD